ncbi:hypothetical protein PFISCL1PPCAC_3154, partial [Pristionchus fissidentatus]
QCQPHIRVHHLVFFINVDKQNELKRNANDDWKGGGVLTDRNEGIVAAEDFDHQPFLLFRAIAVTRKKTCCKARLESGRENH